MMLLRSLFLLLVVAGWSQGGTLILKRAWIEQFKDRATIDATWVRRAKLTGKEVWW